MKALIISDSHGADEKLTDIMKMNSDADTFVFLGDGERDFEDACSICGIYPYGTKMKAVLQVRGNCDIFSHEAVTVIGLFENTRVLITHGFDQNVKTSYRRLVKEALEKNCSIALFGHTHIKELQTIDGVTIFNPGSVRNGSYGIVTVNNGTVKFEHKTIY